MPLIETSSGVGLFYELDGKEGAPVVVLSNSIGTTLEMWDAQAAVLASRYRVLRYDTRGHGRSQVVDAPCSVETLADDLAGLLTVLGIGQADVVGLSLGGMTAQSLAVRHPHLVRGLVLMATAAHLPGNWTERAATVRAEGMESLADVSIGRWFTTGFAVAEPETVARQRAVFVGIAPEGYARCCEAIAAMDLRAALPGIGARTLVVAGAEDPATPPAMAEEIRAGIPGATLVVLPHAAHLLNIEQAEAAARHLVAFLDAGDPAPTAFQTGLANRRAVLGAAHVDRSLANAGPFAMPWQDFITRMAWGEVWGDATIPWKTRSLVTLSLMVALGREEEFKLHVRPALRNGVTPEELRSLLIQCAVYAGVPAANGAFRWVKEVLGDELPQ